MEETQKAYLKRIHVVLDFVYLNDPHTHPEHKCILDICIPIKNTAQLKSSTKAKSLNYHQLIDFMKELRRYFQHHYEATFTFGNIYKGSPEYSYFSLTTEALKTLKLKFVIILDHHALAFSICLSGQNKSIRKKYWHMFKDSTWVNYHIAESIEKSLMIIDHTLVASPNFIAREELTEEIAKEAFAFMNNLREILE